jgi:hypothetical protein
MYLVAGQWSSKGWASPLRKKEDRLFDVGLLDFAGCGPVHMIGGLAGLAGAWVVGPRIGRFGADGKVQCNPFNPKLVNLNILQSSRLCPVLLLCTCFTLVQSKMCQSEAASSGQVLQLEEIRLYRFPSCDSGDDLNHDADHMQYQKCLRQRECCR